jgi:hypothetical protein
MVLALLGSMGSDALGSSGSAGSDSESEGIIGATGSVGAISAQAGSLVAEKPAMVPVVRIKPTRVRAVTGNKRMIEVL